MTIYGMPLSEIPFTTWWMLGSALIAFLGYTLLQIHKFITGTKMIVTKDGPAFNATEAALRDDFRENRPFKRAVASRTLRGPAGNAFFWIMIAGLAAHVAFWVYAAMFMA